MDKILIIKLGALGDVIRTTPLLRALKGDITWATQGDALPLLRNNPYISKLVELEKSFPSLVKQRYDLILNLEEDALACRLASEAQKTELVGPYQTASGVGYTDSSREWFDMSLISKFGKKIADRKKWANRKSYQEILFKMVGKKFRGEEYVLPKKPNPSIKIKTVGLETRSGERWIAKRWTHFPQFIQFLGNQKMDYASFHQSPTLNGFMDQIAGTDAVVTSDSLALHIALGLRKKIVALFTCTSPHEIYGYGRTVKIVSPLLKKYYYTTEPTLKPGEAIPSKVVEKALLKWMRKK